MASHPPVPIQALALRLALWATARVEAGDGAGWVVVDDTGRHIDDRARLLGRSPIGRGITTRLIARHGPIARPAEGEPATALRFTTRAEADAVVADQRRRAAWLMLAHLDELHPPGAHNALYRSLCRAWPARLEIPAGADEPYPDRQQPSAQALGTDPTGTVR